jgi:hypothetical protein
MDLITKGREEMKILAIARVDPQTTLEKMQSHLEAEVRHAWKLYKEGTL